ncbi:DUF1850 domain-containing protein [Brevibacillus sp. SYP-B805]|uniref:DUF1850 domain-containing protein n=1 Tax=Brevibacillus sp. SYP-B805 TaxID=1578199 RepID=UPI0013EC6F7E|nr:DUF1850 domain-containing protein [Brevibacillus sp. SYP-B805]NGQ96666.1 DUF1850 domain-containing protein [Brevibacillus sp. SYP-B805]
MHKSTTAGTAKGRTAFRLFSFLIVLAALSFLLSIPLFTVLAIREIGSNRLVWSHDVQEGSRFGIRWTHSIHRTPVEEFYQVQGGKVVLVEETFKEYGIGMESGLAPGEKLLIEKDRFRIVGMNRIFPALHLFIGQVRANHTLLFQGQEIPLGTLDTPGSAVTIQVEKQSIWQRIGG